MGYIDDLPYLYGKLNKEVKLNTYTGESTDTAAVVINNSSNIITTDVNPTIILGSVKIDTSSNEMVFSSRADTEISRVQLSGFQQEQSNLAETDSTSETFVKNKSTRYLSNEGSSGNYVYAEIAENALQGGHFLKWDDVNKIISDGGTLNIENGTGTGSLVQKTVSSSGVPYANEASGSGAVAFGKDTKANGNCAFTIGQVNTGDGDGGFVFGNSNHNYTGGDYAILGGFNNENKGADAVVLGRDNKNGDSNYAFILGLSNQISDNCYESGALGSSNKITSQKSIALGLANNLVHERTYAIGNGLKSTNAGQLLLGRFNSNDREGLIAIGCGDDDNNRDTAAVLVKNGTNPYEFRLYKDVIMTYNNLSAQNLSAQNLSAKYIDASSGIYLKHKLVSTVSNLDNGVGTGSVAQSGNTAGGTKSAAFGDNTNANRYAQTVVGKYNLDNDEVNTARFVVGNGSAQQRSNAFVVLDDGRAKVKSAPVDDNDVVRKGELDKIAVKIPTQEQMAILF